MSKLISIIVPCYNEGASLPYFYKEVCGVFQQMETKYSLHFELLFVDDGSKDNTLSLVKSYAEKDSRVKYISFSRNFGKESAIYAGLQNSTGDYVAMMDADLQDPPQLLDEMYELIISGEYDCIGTRRTTRKGEPPIRSFFAKCFYKLINRISNADIVDGARDFRLMTRQMTDAILSISEYNRFSKGIFGWVGFKTEWLGYQILCLFIAMIFILIIIVKTIIWGDPVAGYPSMMCVIFFLGGLQLFSIGILGQYLSKTYLETKHRPIYIIKETNYKDER